MNSQKYFKKEQVGGLTLPDFKTYRNITIIVIEWYWQRGIEINGTENLERTITFIINSVLTKIPRHILFNKC